MSNLEHYFENLLFSGEDCADEPNKNALSKEQQEAVETCANYVLFTIFCGREDFIKHETRDQKSGEDLIYRQAAIDSIWDGTNMDIYTSEVKEILEGLPSVQPKVKTGKWLVYTDCEGKTRQCVCNQCGYKTGKYTWKNPNFCENCGKKMEAESEEA